MARWTLRSSFVNVAIFFGRNNSIIQCSDFVARFEGARNFFLSKSNGTLFFKKCDTLLGLRIENGQMEKRFVMNGK